MFKYFLIVFLFWCQCREYVSEQYEGDTLAKNIFERNVSSQNNETLLLLPQNSTTLNGSEIAGKMKKKLEITKDESTIYHDAGRTIFYTFSEQQFNKLLSAIGRYDNNNNNDSNNKLLPHGYVVTPGIGAHKLHLRKMPWKKARQACIREGGDLVIINTESEEELLLNMLQEKNVSSAWVGFLFQHGNWITVNDDTIENAGYIKWETAYSNAPNCGVLAKEHTVSDGPCFFTHSFFCEISI